MKRFLKVCSILLVFVLLVNMLPMHIFAEEYRETIAASSEETEKAVATSNVEIVEEISEKRTEYTKEFLLSNGLHMAAVYPDAVHYETNGGWAEIDNTLVAKTDGTYTNTAGVWNVSFPQQLTDSKSVTIEKDGYTLSFAMAGELRGSGLVMDTKATAAVEQFSVTAMQMATAAIQPIDKDTIQKAYEYAEMAPLKQRSQLAYTNVYQNTDIIYDLDSNKVKESIVMDAYSSTLRGYRYTLNVGTMVPVLEEDGQVTFYDPDRETVIMVMPAPYLVDDAGEYNYDIQVQLAGKGSTYILSYLLPQQWLAAEDRAWPVILDPVVTAELTTANIRDRTVAERATHAQNWGMLDAGYASDEGIIRSYLMYRNLPAISSSDVIVAAAIQLYKYEDSRYTAPIEVHKVNDTWDSGTITWANKPGFDTTVEDYAIVKNAGHYNWDITDIARDWYANDNTGVLFKASDAVEAAGTDNFKQFISSDYTENDAYQPLLAIWFRNNNGLESYWDYTASSAGRAGTGYINNFTGNLVVIRDDLSITGNRMPVTIRHIYNANDSANNSCGMGCGWRTNYNQMVYQWSVNSNYYVWEDADGTEHYFKHDSGSTYKDEDGLELTLTVGSNGTEKYCITDKNGIKSFFDTYGRLRKIQNNQQTPSSISISYTTTSGRLIDAVGNGIGSWFKFFYSNGLLYKISAQTSTGSTYTHILFTYTDSNLTAVTNIDGKVCTYGYDSSGQLRSVQDIDGYKLTYTYHPLTDASWQPYRVKSVSESDGTANGGSLTMEYAHNQTTFTDHNDNVEIHQFNNFGNTICIQDDEGHAQYTQYAFNTDDEKNNNTDSTKKGNQIRLASKLQNSVGSRFADNSFEKGTVWSPHGDNVTTSVTTEAAYIGNASQKIVTSVYSKNYTAFSPNFPVYGGETVTASAYIKNPDADTALEMHYYDSSAAAYRSVSSPVLSENEQWQRAEVTLTNTGSEVLWVYIHLRVENPGTYYVDCVQVEGTETASRYNLVTNGDFRSSGVNSGSYCWYYDSLSGTDGPVHADESPAAMLDTFAMQMTGSPTETKQVYQNITVSGNAGDTFVLAGWAKGDSAPLTNENRQFCLKAVFYNTDGSTTTRTVNFSPDTDSTENWQYAAAPVMADKAYTWIRLLVVYGNNVNTVLFDGIQLYKEEFGTSYTYDADGNVKSVTDLQKQTTTYEYANNDLTKVIQNNKAKMTYDYDDHHNVIKATTQEGLVYEFTYDPWGNNTSVSITGEEGTMTSTATYSTDGNRLVSTTDALGKVTTYHYNADTNVLEWVQYPEDTEDTRTEYTYDSMYRVASAACETDTGNSLSATYTYTDDLLTEIETATTTYNFSYGDFGLRTGVSIGEWDLATYHYTNDQNHYLSSLDYGNGDGVEYEYDGKGRVIKETFMDGDTEQGTVTYAYDNNGALAKVTDSATGITTTYYYDFTDRMMKYVESSDGYSHSVGYEYDVQNNLTQLVETINGVEHTTSYTYDDDNRIESITNGAISEEYYYDEFGRVDSQTIWHNGIEVVAKYISYQSPASGKTSAQVESYQIDSEVYTVVYTYTYDDNGNITSVSDGINTTSYAYDSANQLIRENNQAGGFTRTWTYDDGGNIISIDEYDYTTGELGEPNDTYSYYYDDSAWGDLQTERYDAELVTDAIGNLLEDDMWTYTWEHGRQLASMSSSPSNVWTFTYNADGMRTKRTNGTNTYTYVYNGSQLSQMTKGTDTLYFTYDAGGTPTTVTYNGTIYYYATNLQGDIVAILNSASTAVVKYTYDAWGNPLSRTGTMASTLGSLNPLRYRGYVYDQETWLYYLQSRYYNPAIGRFISADGQISGVGGEVLGYNQFAYCFNNPVNLTDSTGNWPKWLSGALNVASGFAQGALGAVIGATVGWTGIGAVAAGALILNGAATATQGVGQIYNAVSSTNTFREDNIIRTGVQTAGYVVGGDTGAMVAGMAYDTGIMVAAAYAPSAQAPIPKSTKTTYISRGSTATRQPSNLTEKLALEQVMSNPQGRKLPITMTDPRWPASQGWVKMQQIVNTHAQGKICIHYVYNEVIGIFDDFKLK